MRGKLQPLFGIFALAALFIAAPFFTISLPLLAQTASVDYEKIARDIYAEPISKMNRLSQLTGGEPVKVITQKVSQKLSGGHYFTVKLEHPQMCEKPLYGDIPVCPYYAISLNEAQPVELLKAFTNQLYYNGKDAAGYPMFSVNGPKGGMVVYGYENGVYVPGEERLP